MGLLPALLLIISTLSPLTQAFGGPLKVNIEILLPVIPVITKPLQVDVESLSAEQKKAVDFAVVQLQGLEEGGCGKQLLRVENFSQQVRLQSLARLINVI